MLKEKQSIKTESVAAMTDLSRIKREVGGEGGSTSRKVKIKLEVSEEQTCVKTPELSQTPMSDFVSSLKVRCQVAVDDCQITGFVHGAAFVAWPCHQASTVYVLLLLPELR